MASTLASQLQQLAVARGQEIKTKPKGTPSFLYSPTEAAELDLQTLFGVGRSGFKELCGRDGRFQQYAEGLFSSSGMGVEREQLTAAQSAELDRQLKGFLQILSSYFLTASAGRVIEYFIRRYKVHVYNVDALMACALPYHSTNRFVRLVQVLKLEEGLWSFLAPMQQSGAALPRNGLIQTCVRQPAVLRFICDAALGSVVEGGGVNQVMLSFYAVAVAEVLAALPQVQEEHLSLLLPFLVKGLKSDAMQEYRSATYMVLGALASHATLSGAFLDKVLEQLCRGRQAAQLRELLMLLCLLVVHQRPRRLPAKAVRFLLQTDGLAEEFAAVQAQGVHMELLLRLLLAGACGALVRESAAQAAAQLQAFAAGVDLGQHAEHLTRRLLDAAMQAQREDDDGSWPTAEVNVVLRILEQRYPHAVDAAVNACLADLPSGASSGDDRGPLVAFLQRAFADSASAPVEGGNATVLNAIDGSSSAMRVLALGQLDSMLAAGKASDSTLAFAKAAVLRRLTDDNPDVLEAALSLACLPQLPQQPLFDALARAVTRSAAEAGNRSRSREERGAFCRAAERALEVLVACFGGFDTLAASLQAVLLEALAATSGRRRLCLAAIRAAAELPSDSCALLAGLARLPAQLGMLPTAPQAAASGAGKRRQKQADAAASAQALPEVESSDLDIHRAVVEALGGALVQQAAAAQQAAATAAYLQQQPHLRCAQHLLALAVAAALQQAQRAASPELLEAALALLQMESGLLAAGAHRPEAPSSEPEEELDAAALQRQAGVDAHGTPVDMLFPEQGARQQAVSAWLLLSFLASLHPPHLEQLSAGWTLEKLFERVAELQPSGHWRPHVRALVHSVQAAGGAPLVFLARTACDPGRSASAQAHALDAMAEVVAASGCATASASDSSPGAQPRKLRARARKRAAVPGRVQDELLDAAVPCCLAALASPSRPVRAAAVKLASGLPAALEGGGETACGLAAVLGALANGWSDALLGDSSAAAQLLEATLAAETSASSASAAAKATPAANAAAAFPAGLPVARRLSYGLELEGAEGLRQARAALLALLQRQDCDSAASIHCSVMLLSSFCSSSCAATRAAALQAALEPLTALLSRMQLEAALLPAAQELCCLALALMEPHVLRSIAPRPQQQQLRAAQLLLAMATDSGDPRPATLQDGAVRSRTFSCIDAPLLAVLPNAQALLQALLRGSRSDAAPEPRDRARQALDHLRIPAALLQPILEALPDLLSGPCPADGSPHAEASRSRRKRTKASSEASAASAAGSDGLSCSADDGLAALELLAAKSVAEGELQLVPVLQSGAARLMQAAATAAPAGSPAADAEEPEARGYAGERAEWDDEEGSQDEPVTADAGKDSAAAQAPAQAAGSGSSTVSYALQLALAALQAVAARCQEAGTKSKGSAFDLQLAVRFVRDSPDGSCRSAALSLLSTLVSWQPAKALEHVLEVLSLASKTAALQEDRSATQIASATMSAVAATWIAAGRPVEALWERVVEAVPTLPPHRRLVVLAALLEALPQEHGVETGVLLLLRKVEALEKGTRKRRAAGGQAVAAEATSEDGPSVGPEEQLGQQLLGLAASLARKVEPEARVAALARLLAEAREASGARVQAALPRLSVAFALQELQALSASGGARVAALIQAARSADAQATPLGRSCHQLMSQVLESILQLGLLDKKGAEEAASGSRVSAKLRRRVKAVARELYQLLQALQARMDPASFLQALVASSEHGSERMRQKALRLLAKHAAALQKDMQELEAVDSDLHKQLMQRISAVVHTALPLAAQSLHAAAAAAAAASPATRQAALLALDALARAVGRGSAAAFAEQVPVVAEAAADSHWVVRGSALACLASLARAIGHQLVPHLPKTMRAVLDATQQAAEGMAAGEQTSTPAAGASAGRADAEEAQDEDEDGEGEELGAGRKASEAQSVVVTGGLAALEALLDRLGSFLAPHVGAMLQLLLRPDVLQSRMAACAGTAERLLRKLPQVVEPRLLLPPLCKQVRDVPELGTPAALALLKLLQDLAASMEPGVAATFRDAIFGALLKALDVRTLCASGPMDVGAVERGATAALAALVMKLSESSFKPLFLRLIDWSRSASAPDAHISPQDGAAVQLGAAPQLARQVALFGVASALSDKLRSVFVPYHKHLLEPLLAQLEAAVARADKAARPTKKRRRSKGDGVAGAAQDELQWLALLKALRALHRCLLYDTVGFLTPQRFHRLLPHIVSQLDVAAPEGALAAMDAEDGGDAELDAQLQDGSHAPLDVLARASASCALQLALAGGSDALWKPLNHQVLLLTRSARPRTRLLALEVVFNLVRRLREEFLVLLPETLPFLAELMEDTQQAVQARVQELIALLEELSGEKLDDYLRP